MDNKALINDAQIEKINAKITEFINLLSWNNYPLHFTGSDIFTMIRPDQNIAEMSRADFFNLVSLSISMYSQYDYPVYSELEYKNFPIVQQN